MKKNKNHPIQATKNLQNSVKTQLNSINFFKSSPPPPQLNSLFCLLNSQSPQKPVDLPPKHHIFTPSYPTKGLLNQPKTSISQPWQSSCQTANLPQEHTL